MDSTFPATLSSLRKERGFSQKQVAMDLGISQALLSHYEKGVRECGLAFVVKVSEYYGVSCDYLLGLKQKNDTVAQSEDETEIVRDRRQILNSLYIVFGILEKINSDKLTAEVSRYLSYAVYRTYRLLFSSNQKSVNNIFEINEKLYSTRTASEMFKCEATARMILADEEQGAKSSFKKRTARILNSSLEKDYPDLSSSLIGLIKQLEGMMISQDADLN